MKTFTQFMLIAEDKMGERLGNMSDTDFDQFLKGRTPGESQTYKEKRVKFKKTKVSSKDAGFGSQSNTQTPPKGTQTQTPPRGTQTPPRGTQTPPRGTQTPPRGTQTQTPPKGTQTPPKSSSSLVSSTTKQAEKSAVKTAGKGILRRLGKIVGPASAALDVADERAKGSGWLRSGLKAAVVGGAGALGAAAATPTGPVGSIAAATGASMAASKAFDVAAGANAKERKGIATANRKSQAGGAIKGVGGKTSFDTKKNTITSGGKTAQLGKTSVVTNPKTGKQEVGNLAYKNGQAVYKRSDTKSLAQTSSNPLERIGRTINPNAYKQSDAANTTKKFNQAKQSDVARNKALGVKLPPGK